MHAIVFNAGTSIDHAATLLCEAAAQHGEASGKFNDIEMHAAAGYAPAGIVRFYREECERRAEAYRKSPEGIAAAKEADQRRADLQATHDRLMRRLPALVMSRPHDALDWLCQMQECTDHVGVIVRKQTIIDVFERGGYNANENTGADYRDGDRENMCRYIIGQCLAGLKEGPAIHPIVHKFAREWRERFRVHG